MADNKLVLKSISQLFEYSFFIPAYQRGYRWTTTQVTQLLEDIWQFAKNPPKHEEGKEKPFYCLQPIVVKTHGNEWEVIDGQQRLTTIFLVIHYFNEMWIGKLKIEEPKIKYETRLESTDFLAQLEIDIDTNDIKKKGCVSPNENIDFSHMANAYKSIHDWVIKKDNDLDNNKLQSVFQNDTKVIWYEVEEKDSNSIDVFTRLNIGKIPLTNAELVKAIFLQTGNFSEEKATLKQIKIASEWDAMEKTLQDDSFWYFIYNQNSALKYDNRIEYIFDLMKGKTNDSEYYHTFNKFLEVFPSDKNHKEMNIDKMWLDVKKYFLTFDEWFKDNELFHYIGFLVDCEKDIKKVKKESEEKSKIDFKEYLKAEIRKEVNYQIDQLDYQSDSSAVRKILLLLNIQTVLETQKSDMRFPFHKYKSEDWDIEHVRSQNDKEDTEKIKGKPEDWMQDILEYFVGSADIDIAKEFVKGEAVTDEEKEINEICKRLIEFSNETNKEQKKNKFDKAFDLVQEYFKESEKPDNIDSICNLALLDAKTNRSYGNAFFPIKRKRIIENDRNGIFVPIATKNLFLKYYSKKLGEVMYWNKEDARNYFDAIKETLKDFLPEEMKK